MADEKHSLNVPVTIQQVCNDRDGRPDIKVWGGKALQRCKVSLEDGREASVRIGARGLKPGDKIVLVDMRSWPNTHKPGQYCHAADNALCQSGAPWPTLLAPAPQAAAPSSIPGAAPAQNTRVHPQLMIDGLAAYGAEIVKVTKTAFLDGRGSGCTVEEFAVVYGCSHKAGREEGLLRQFVTGWRPDAPGADGPPRDSDEPPLTDPSELPPDDDIPF